MDRETDSYRLDKTAFSTASMGDNSDEKAYWQAQPPAARLEALQFMRQVMYGEDAATARLQRILEVISAEDLRVNKQASGRLKDLSDLENLP